MKSLEKVLQVPLQNYVNYIFISGVEFLSLVVARVPQDKLNRQSGTTIDCKN
jgi:hypothetical protein